MDAGLIEFKVSCGSDRSDRFVVSVFTILMSRNLQNKMELVEIIRWAVPTLL